MRKKIGDDSLPAKISSIHLEGKPVNEQVLLTLRGNNRREICSIPPIKISFIKSYGSRLHSLESLKLVNPCDVNSTFQELLIKEYLIYKMYNVLSEMSLKVRLANITYHDSLGKRKSFSKYTFFIEDIDVLAKRNDSKELNHDLLGKSQMDRENMTSVGLFQFMIGNTDWTLRNSHNVRFVVPQKNIANKIYVIPYDFDYSGMVDAPYATPTMDIGIDKVTSRVFFGKGRTLEEIEKAYEPFQKHKEKFYSIINDCELLNNYSKNEMVRYLNSFYSIMENKRDMEYYMIRNAR